MSEELSRLKPMHINKLKLIIKVYRLTLVSLEIVVIPRQYL